MRSLYDKAERKALPLRIHKADTFFQRLQGLMFRRQPLKEDALWLIPCNGIHMCFMRFSIDAIFLDEQLYIVKLASHVKPWTFVSPAPTATSVLEVPAGMIQRLSLQVGDQLDLQ